MVLELEAFHLQETNTKLADVNWSKDAAIIILLVHKRVLLVTET